MSLYQRHIKQSTTINEGSYALSKPTNAAFISKETIQTDAEKEDIRQTSQVVYAQSGLVKNTQTKGQTQTPCAFETMEGKTLGFVA